MPEINPDTGLPQDSAGIKPYLQMGNAYQTTGVQRTLYQNVDFNMMNWPQSLLYQALQSGSIAPTLPNPIVGLKLQLPDGDTTVPALGWQSANAVGSGLYRVGVQDFGWVVNSSLVTEWLASEFRINYLTPGSVLFAAASGKVQQNNASFFWDNTNFRLGLGSATPRVRLDVLDASNPQFRLTQADNSVYTAFQTSSGGVLLVTPTGHQTQFTEANVGSFVLLDVRNSDNTNASSNARLRALVGGSSAGDPYVNFNVPGTQDWSIGIDNSLAQALVIAHSSVLGSAADVMWFLTGGNIGINTSGPDRKLDILDASNPQLRLTQADGTVFADLQSLSTGEFRLMTSGNLFTMQNGASAQTLRIYGTTTGPVYLQLSNTGVNGQLFTNSGAFQFGSVGAVQWQVDTGGNLITTTDNSPDVGNSNAHRPRQVFIAQPSITPGSGTGITLSNSGAVRKLTYKVVVTFQALAAAALTADATIATFPAKTKVVGIYADTTTKYVGGGVTAATLIVGKTVGGNEYVVSHDVFTAAITRGLADGDLGTSINRANAVQGGDLPSWTATTAVSVRLTTVTANTNALTQGSTTYYIDTIVYP